jgi:HSP20 family protein
LARGVDWRPFDDMRREMNRFFENFDRDISTGPFGRSGFEISPLSQSGTAGLVGPAMDVLENDKGYQITAELAGLDEKNIELNLTGGELTIKGEKQDDHEETGNDYYIRERQFGSFERRFVLPDDVDATKIQANFQKGLLTVTLPKKAEAQKPTQKIEVKAAA